MTGPVRVILPGLCGVGGLTFQADGFRLLFLAAAVFMWCASGTFSLEYMAHYEKRKRYQVFFWITLPAVAGVFLSADFYTAFVFFEIMSLTSYVWVAFDETPESLRAAETYLAVAVIGGLVMLMGLFLLKDLCGTLDFAQASAAAQEILAQGSGAEKRRLYEAGLLILFGFGAKAGCVPLHIWLPKAHPVAPAPASALLSGILTKAGVYGVIVLSCGLFYGQETWGQLLAVLGLATMFWGAFLAVFSINLKRTLACSSVSQIGFILTGIAMAVLLSAAGEEPGLAVRGTLLHMINHAAFKLVLFLCAGAVFMNLHRLDLNEIRGCGRGNRLLAFCFLMGALGISGVPFWSGYVSKTLLHESIVEYAALTGSLWWRGAEWLFLFTGGMTAAYMTKLFVALFVERPAQGMRSGDSSLSMKGTSKGAILVPALLILIAGLLPGVVMDRLALLGQDFFREGLGFHPAAYFSFENLKGAAISLILGAALYAGIRRFLMEDGRYVDRLPAWFDLEDLVYRPVLTTVLPGVCRAVCSVVDAYIIAVPVRIFLAVSAVSFRCLDQLADGVILAARKTTHSQRPKAAGTAGAVKAEGAPVLSAGLSQAGAARNSAERACPGMDGDRSGMDRGRSGMGGARASLGDTRRRWQKKLRWAAGRIRHVWGMIEESFSFGLILFAMGLCATIGYLLLTFFQHR